MMLFLRACFFLVLTLVLPTASWAQQQRVSAGSAHTVVIKPDGTLWAWGSNGVGQVGDGTTSTRRVPQCISTATNWVNVSAGESHTLALRADGTLWAWGLNNFGALGTGQNVAYSTRPTQVGSDRDWVSMAAGGGHSLAVKTDGTLWSWGYNDGALGNGTRTPRSEPTRVGTDSDWLLVSAGSGYSMAIRRNGTLWSWGGDVNGQLGTPQTRDDTLPAQVGTDSDWIAVSAGYQHTLGIRRGGSLWGWGSNDYQQLDPTRLQINYSSPIALGTATNWVSITAGSYHSLAVRADGTLWAWGLNSVGQLGGSLQSPARMQQVGTNADWVQASAASDHTIAVRADGSIWSWGYNGLGSIGTLDLTLRHVTEPLQVGAATSWRSLAAGQNHTAALQADSTLWIWGSNQYGQLGQEPSYSRNDSYQPVQVAPAWRWKHVACGPNNTFAVRADGTLWAWGDNPHSQLGLGASVADGYSVYQPHQVGTATNWVSVAVGDEHTLATRTDGTLWAWGYNAYGQAGNSSGSDVTTPRQVGTDTKWAHVAATQQSSLALASDGTLWAWGANGVGQLGIGTTFNQSHPTQVGTSAAWTSLAAGLGHVMAVQADGTLWAWGYNLAGQLGDGTTTNRSSPVQVGVGASWRSVSAGVAHSVALRTDGTLWQWGAYAYYIDPYSPPAAMKPAPVPGAGSNWTNVTAGHAHSVALRADGSLWAWGLNTASQLGNQIYTDVPVLISLRTGLATYSGQGRQTGLLVFPNPAHASVSVVRATTDPVVLLDLLGRVVLHLPTGQQRVSLADIPPGLYFVQQGHSTTRLVVE